MKLDIATLRHGYASGTLTPAGVLAEIRKRIAATKEYNAWLYVLSEEALQPYLERLEEMTLEEHPLWGIPFAIKDNIDLAGCPTTAACPDFSYLPDTSAAVVERLLEAGALPIGKTNLDQFATGLVGTRSPHGPTCNALNPEMISGGSSAGSAVAVKLGLCSFALGTDTAGSGRVPAALNALVGFKPTPGWWSTRGVVPACRTLDCVSVFTETVADAEIVSSVAGVFDVTDPYARSLSFAGFDVRSPRFGTLSEEALAPCDAAHRAAYQAWVAELPQAHSFDTECLFQTAELLYQGPWLAERYVALSEFMGSHPDSIYPTTLEIIQGAAGFGADDAFRAQYKLAELRRQCDALFASMDVLVVPSVPTTYRIDEVLQDPIATNSRMGTYTNFVNLLDLCAIAIPAGTLENDMPFGVTLIAQSGRDHALMELAAVLTAGSNASLSVPAPVQLRPRPGEFLMAVCGAHLAGQPLNTQLTERGGYLVKRCTTSPNYRLYALPDNKRPALVRDERHGERIELEVWSIDSRTVGSFIQGVAPPLGIGSVELADGAWVKGFIAEPCAATGAKEITALGGWREHLAMRALGAQAS